MYGMTPIGVFFTAIFPLVINGQALCQQPQIAQMPRIITYLFPTPTLQNSRKKEAFSKSRPNSLKKKNPT